MSEVMERTDSADRGHDTVPRHIGDEGSSSRAFAGLGFYQ